MKKFLLMLIGFALCALTVRADYMFNGTMNCMTYTKDQLHTMGYPTGYNAGMECTTPIFFSTEGCKGATFFVIMDRIGNVLCKSERINNQLTCASEVVSDACNHF